MLRRVYSRFAHESFRQSPVCKVLKSFRLHVGSVPQLLLPDQLLKEEVYTCVSHFFVSWLR